MAAGQPEPTRTVVVMGAAYGGTRAAQLIAAGLPDGWRIVLVDRNSHVNHVYILPRLAVLPGHEHKAFVPYDNVFLQEDNLDCKHTFIQARITSLNRNSVTLSKAFPEYGIDTETLHFDYAVYALGSHLPAPLNLWGSEPDGKTASHTYGGSKPESIAWLKGKQKTIEDATSVLVVGGGALGIQFATDIAAVHPGKPVTLLHSRSRLLPRFDHAMHTEILQSLESANVDVILGERLDLSSTKPGHRTVHTMTGREVNADLILLCTGQRPNTDFLKSLDPNTVDPSTSLAHVLRTMQLGVLSVPSTSAAPSVVDATPAHEDFTSALEAALEQIALQDLAADAHHDAEDDDAQEDDDDDEAETTPYPHIFVVGDAADAFGAIPAGHNAYYQAEVAARNVLRLIRRDERLADEALELYTPGAPAIKVSLGLKKNVYQVNGVVGVGKEERDDLNAPAIWSYFGFQIKDEAEMYL
ncbi:hypothetical protein B0H10DRAFT_1976725 [Mycena sp. CBHHK59/15]|nr:hypothetical protein B0H10DRAFT_1976725 [Mycena sp. CBHHK59/15]